MAYRAFANVDPRLLSTSVGTSIGASIAKGIGDIANVFKEDIDKKNKAKLKEQRAINGQNQVAASTMRNTKSSKDYQRMGAEVSSVNVDDASSTEDDFIYNGKRVDFTGVEALGFKPDKAKYVDRKQYRADLRTWKQKRRTYVRGKEDEVEQEAHNANDALGKSIKLNKLPKRIQRTILENLGKAGQNKKALLQYIGQLSTGRELSNLNFGPGGAPKRADYRSDKAFEGAIVDYNTSLKASPNSHRFLNAVKSNADGIKAIQIIPQKDNSVLYKVLDKNTGEYVSIDASLVGADGTGWGNFEPRLLQAELDEKLQTQAEKSYKDDPEGKYKVFQSFMQDPKEAARIQEMLSSEVNAAELATKFPSLDTNKDKVIDGNEAQAFSEQDIWAWIQGNDEASSRQSGAVDAKSHVDNTLRYANTFKINEDNPGARNTALAQLQAIAGDDVHLEDGGGSTIKVFKVGENSKNDNEPIAIYDLNTIEGTSALSVEGAEEAKLSQFGIEAITPYLQQRKQDREVVEADKAYPFRTLDGKKYQASSVGIKGEDALEMIKNFDKANDDGQFEVYTAFGAGFGPSKTLNDIPEAQIPAFRYYKKYGTIPKELLDPNISMSDKWRFIYTHDNASGTGESDDDINNSVLGGSPTTNPTPIPFIKGSPLKRFGDGETDSEGNITIDPSLEGEERETAVQHEEEHKQEIEEGNLDYDDDNVYYNDKSYARRNGEVNYDGSWVKEGDKSLPWEAAAYEAENGGEEAVEAPKGPALIDLGDNLGDFDTSRAPKDLSKYQKNILKDKNFKWDRKTKTWSSPDYKPREEEVSATAITPAGVVSEQQALTTASGTVTPTASGVEVANEDVAIPSAPTVGAFDTVKMSERLKNNLTGALKGVEINGDNFEQVKEVIHDELKFGPHRTAALEALGFDAKGNYSGAEPEVTTEKIELNQNQRNFLENAGNVEVEKDVWVNPAGEVIDANAEVAKIPKKGDVKKQPKTKATPKYDSKGNLVVGSSRLSSAEAELLKNPLPEKVTKEAPVTETAGTYSKADKALLNSDTASNIINQESGGTGYVPELHLAQEGQWTTSYGSTLDIDGNKFKEGDTVTKEMAEKLMLRDLKRAKTGRKWVGQLNLSEPALKILDEFAYNVGGLEGLTKNGTRDEWQIAAKMLEYIQTKDEVKDGKFKNDKDAPRYYTTGLHIRRIREAKAFIATLKSKKPAWFDKSIEKWLTPGEHPTGAFPRHRTSANKGAAYYKLREKGYDLIDFFK